jgi:hypothetical protein
MKTYAFKKICPEDILLNESEIIKNINSLIGRDVSLIINLKNAIMSLQFNKICKLKPQCIECGAEIGFDWVVPTKSYILNENGNIRREDNLLYDTPYITFYCTEDREHDWHTSEDLVADLWKTCVEIKFLRKNPSEEYLKKKRDE